MKKEETMETELKIKRITLSAKIIRAGGTVEDLGVIAESDPLATEADLVVEKIEPVKTPAQE